MKEDLSLAKPVSHYTPETRRHVILRWSSRGDEVSLLWLPRVILWSLCKMNLPLKCTVKYFFLDLYIYI
jgi:hypothetical protein